ncbi:MAG: hypothetical protein SV760_00690, partial [Halobacteria archaeon]|nr:hypothetical protein [Halobacteria archaeon]
EREIRALKAVERIENEKPDETVYGRTIRDNSDLSEKDVSWASSRLEQKGLIEQDAQGSRTVKTMTEKGKDVLSHVRGVEDLLDETIEP